MSETRQQKKQSFAEKWGLKPDYTVDSWTLAEAVAGDLFERMDARAAEGMTLDQVLRWFRKPQDEESWQPQYLDEWDRRRVFDLLVGSRARLRVPVWCAVRVGIRSARRRRRPRCRRWGFRRRRSTRFRRATRTGRPDP